MNTALEFHDCSVSSITSDGAQVCLNFNSAYLHVSEGIPGVDDGTGWVQEAKLVFSGAKWHGSFAIGEGWLMDGQITIEPSEATSMLPVPFEAAGIVSATFYFTNGCALAIEAESALLTLIGEARYVEEYRAQK